MNILMAVAGALSIYLGYGLFCDSAYQKSRIRHLVSGALLALFGLGILIADARGIRAARPDSPASSQSLQKKKSTKEGSFDAPQLNKRLSIAERLA